MKRILVAAGILLLVQGAVWAAATTQEAEVNVEVESVFSISVDQGFVDFERMKPGEVKWNIPYTALTTTSKTNRNNPWYLKINTIGDLTSGDSNIPSQNLSWYGWTQGLGTWYGRKENPLTTTPILVYSSAPSEYSNFPGGTQNTFKFKLRVPENTKPGIYSTTIKFTMTE